jgi:hypothetical protein
MITMCTDGAPSLVGRAAGLTALQRAALGGLLALATYNLIARSIARAVRDTP